MTNTEDILILKDTLTTVASHLHAAKGVATHLKRDVNTPTIQLAPGAIHTAQAIIERLARDLRLEVA